MSRADGMVTARMNEPTALQKLYSYGSAIVLAAIVGAGAGFFFYTRLLSRPRNVEALAHDWTPFYACVGGGAAIAVFGVVALLVRADPPKPRA